MQEIRDAAAELLRKQLDAVVAEWVRDNTAKAVKAEEQHALSVWAQTVLDQAKRVQDKKRPAQSSDGLDGQASSKPKLDETPQAPEHPHVAPPAPEQPAAAMEADDANSVAAAQLDAAPPQVAA